MAKQLSTISKNVMRRVYYAYTLRLLMHRNTVHVVMACAVVFVLSTFVSFGAVWHNVMQVRVGGLGGYFYSAFANTEMWTLVSCLALLALGISFMRSLGQRAVSQMQLV